MNGGRNLLGLRPPFIFTSTIMKQRTLLVENQVKSLATIEPKACVTWSVAIYTKMLVSISTLILYNKNLGSFTIRLPFNRIMASHVLFTLFGGFFLSASKISSTLLFFFVGSIAFSVFSSIVTFLP